ncbi:uncharacterized protein topaz1 isoform X1 [Corythoichthys intestinalis]|uniref:uncharacterized protein topaz1 isoform X1 n=1 Tax=Corythoichthys intestinalis TaxID=161448 RepID=UPI0025A5DDCF|nr:uncharacterized protein topaz1 isoform X1 [Corythoichthys intestinalis]
MIPSSNRGKINPTRTFITGSNTDSGKADTKANYSQGVWLNRGRASGVMSTGLIPRRHERTTGSEGTLRRIVRAWGCGLCGDCKILPSQRRPLANQVLKNCDPGCEKQNVTQILKQDLCPKVELCKVILHSDTGCHDCGFVLPDALKTKTVHCFKQDVTDAGFQILPSCLGHHKQGSDMHQNGTLSPKLKADNVSQFCGLTENRRLLKYNSDTGTSVNVTAHPFVKNWENDFSSTSSTSAFIGNTTGEHIIKSDLWRATDTIGTEIGEDKIKHKRATKKNGTLEVTPEWNTVKNFLVNEIKRCRTSNCHSQAQPESTVGTCSTFNENCLPEESCEEGDSPRGSEMLEETSELSDDDPASFTCQRVRVQNRKRRDSCARTYMEWHRKRRLICRSTNSGNYTTVISSFSFVPRDLSSSSSTSVDENDSVDGKCLEGTSEEASEKEDEPEKPELEDTNSDHFPDLAKPSSSACCLDDGDGGDRGDDDDQPSSASESESSSSEAADEEDAKGCPNESGVGDTQLSCLDEFTAYQHDILLVHVNHDDSELFGNLPQESLLKLGPNRVHEDPNPCTKFGVSQTLQQSRTPVNINLPSSSQEDDESSSRPWRPKGSTSPKIKTNLFRGNKQTKQRITFNSSVDIGRDIQESHMHVETAADSHDIPPLLTVRNGTKQTEPRSHKFNSYCRMFFSESQTCSYKMCRFLHVPKEGDEEFCVNTVVRFTKNPMCLQRAGSLFAGYYRSNAPGMYFSMQGFLSLLWALLKAGLIPDVLSVLNVCLSHKIVPTQEFLLALFTSVRERGLTSIVPPLIQLTYKMASEHLMLNMDCFDNFKKTPEFQKIIHGNKYSVQSVPFSDSLHLAHVVVEIELCAKQGDWRRMGEAFRCICTPCQHPSQLERISGRIAVALLSESKDKLSVPFVAFTETMCDNEDPNSPLMGFCGRIGVSLMLRYHKTQQWDKGRKVVEAMSQSKVSYSKPKGLFSNEDGGSRCHLITLAAELFLLSGSLEGALKILRENKWFIKSSVWPCKPLDLEHRSRVLICMAEKTSQRDTLEILCNLPGIQEPNDQVDISKYTPLFNAHLQVCVDRLMLTVASDSVDFMLSRKLPVDGDVLQRLLHKLGKQNLWLRAREVFRHSLTVGYYAAVSAPAGFMALIVPCRLGEVELALTFEMLITLNASVVLSLSETTPSSLSITLKRGQESESEYLSAGSRLLSAALIPQPKLEIHYTAVNPEQEQVFTLSIASARRWLRSNHMWANEVWKH